MAKKKEKKKRKKGKRRDNIFSLQNQKIEKRAIDGKGVQNEGRDYFCGDRQLELLKVPGSNSLGSII